MADAMEVIIIIITGTILPEAILVEAVIGAMAPAGITDPIHLLVIVKHATANTVEVFIMIQPLDAQN